MTRHPATPAHELPTDLDLRLVVTDMDGTLLDGHGHLPTRLPQVLERLRAHGVTFVPASGRQHANLLATFGPLLADGPVIAENGTLVRAGQEEIHSSTLGEGTVRDVVHAARALAATGRDLGTVLALKDRAVTDRPDERFLSQCRPYYTLLDTTPDVLDAPLDDVIKIAVYDFGDAETGTAPVLAAAAPQAQVVVSGQRWVDVMAPEASKGLALAAIQSRLGVTPAQTAVFGDYLNDLPLYEHAELGFAMANAHEQVRAAAPYTAPANTEDGVLRTIDTLLDRCRRA